MLKRLGCWLIIAVAALGLAACGQSAALYYADESTGMKDTFPESLMTYNTGLAKWTYSEPGFEVHLSISGGDENELAIEIKNSGDLPITVLWAESGFRDTLGRRWALITEQAEYWSPVADLRPTTIAPGSDITNTLQPARPMERDEALRLAPPTNEQLSQGWNGQVALILAVKTQGVARGYTLRFNPEDLEDPEPIFGPLMP